MQVRSMVFALLACSAALPALSQASPEEQARGLLDDGRSYRAQGKNKQALDNFNTIVTSFASTSSVDDAWLEVGRFHLEVESSFEKARESFETVAKQYPQSDSAPGAYYYLGLLTLERASGQAEIDDALAQFARVQRLYPRSEWVPRALRASAQTQRRAGQLQEAAALARRVALEYPASDAAPEAQFLVGHCLALLDEPRRAMEEFQQVRNRFPQSEWAQRALPRITALWRLHGSSRPSLTLDPGFSVGSGDLLKDVSALLGTPDGRLWIASDKTKSVVPFDPDGKMGTGYSGPDVRALSLAGDGEVVIAAKLAVRLGSRDIKSVGVPSTKPGEMKPLDDIRAAVELADGTLLIADGDRKLIHRYDSKLAYAGAFADAREREVVRMLLGGEREVVVLSRNTRTVEVFDERGKLLRSVGPKGPGFELKKPVDVALDPERNLYVADEEGGVFVISARGQLLTTLSAAELKKPTALALDPAGAVLVYDDRAQRVLRFR